MHIQEYAALDRCNTLGLPTKARYLIQARCLEDVREALAFARTKQLPLIPLGGGSNVVFSGDLDAVVLRMAIAGKSVVSTLGEHTIVESGAGENWHDLVRWTLSQKAYGLENLSLIPGTVGAAPIQNIGAYGVELKDVFHSLQAVDCQTGGVVCFNRDDCGFDYRQSIFKGSCRDCYVIISLRLKLNRRLTPRLDYADLRDKVEKKALNRELSAELISDVVCDVRREKLPDPGMLANVGSFFKNPEVSASTVQQLKARYPDLVAFPAGERWKLAAGWLIDKAGLKGVREGAVGTHKQQALVLVNHGGATGQDVLCFSEAIKARVHARFGVLLEREPRVY